MAPGKTTTANFELTAHNRTQAAFAQLGQAFSQAQARAEKFNKSLARNSGGGGAGGGVMGGLGRMVGPAMAFAGVRSLMTMGDDIGDAADSMQTNVETYQTLKVLARDTAVSITGLGKAFASLNEKKIDALADDTSAAALAFQKLNMSAPLFWLDSAGIFEEIARVMRDPTSSAEKLAAAQDLLGQSATKLMPVYKALAGTSFAELNKALRESGRIVDEEGIKKLSELEAKYQAVMDRLKTMGMGAIVNTYDNTRAMVNDPSSHLDMVSKYYENKAAGFAKQDRPILSTGAEVFSKMTTLLSDLLASSRRIEAKDRSVFQ